MTFSQRSIGAYERDPEVRLRAHMVTRPMGDPPGDDAALPLSLVLLRAGDDGGVDGAGRSTDAGRLLATTLTREDTSRPMRWPMDGFWSSVRLRADAAVGMRTSSSSLSLLLS